MSGSTISGVLQERWAERGGGSANAGRAPLVPVADKLVVVVPEAAALLSLDQAMVRQYIKDNVIRPHCSSTPKRLKVSMVELRRFASVTA